MSSPTNLTDSIARLRDRTGGHEIVSGQRPVGKPPAPRNKPSSERRFATDTFMLFCVSCTAVGDFEVPYFSM